MVYSACRRVLEAADTSPPVRPSINLGICIHWTSIQPLGFGLEEDQKAAPELNRFDIGKKLIRGYEESKLRTISFTIFSVLAILFFLPSAFAESCPALDVSGRPPPLQPAPRKILLDLTLVPPQNQGESVTTALNVVGKYESGGADPWTNVSGQEEISVGFMQWNWRSGSLVSTFMFAVSQKEIDTAPSEIRTGIQALKNYASKPGDANARVDAVQAVKDWTTSKPGDPLVDGRLRRSVVAAWSKWLDTDALRRVQVELIGRDVNKAFAYAVAWNRDYSHNVATSPVDPRLIAYFFDLVTFNGDEKGVWVDQVRTFRKQFPDKLAVIHEAAAWLDTCPSFQSPINVPNRKMYGRKDAAKAAALWRKAVASNPSQFSEDQIDLLVQALLRAQQSRGSDRPKGFPGIYQAEVLMRGGAIALGMGVVHGQVVSTFPSK